MAGARMLIAGIAALGIPLTAAQAEIQVRPVSPAASSCPPAQTSGGMCFNQGTSFETWTGAAFECAQGGGHVPSLGELVGYRSTVASAQTDIECSSNFDIGAGSIWCVGKAGSISGVGISSAKDLSTVKSLYRCVKPIK